MLCSIYERTSKLIKMIAKLNNIYNFLTKTKIIFKKPDHSDAVVLDSTSINEIENVLQSLDWNAVETRNQLIKKIYITPGLIVRFFVNFKNNLKIAYLVSLIDEIKPKIVLTFIDNSFHFSKIAKSMRSKKITFIAIQNAWRGDISENDHFYKKGLLANNPNKDFFLPHFFCLGENDINKYKKYKIKVKKFYKIGSFRMYNYIRKINKKPQKKYDICLISNTTWARKLTGSDITFAKSYAKLANYTIKYVKEKKLKFVFCLKSSNRSRAIQDDEISILKKYLNKEDFNYLKKNSTYKNSEKFLSYNLAFRSTVVVGQTSTILGECLAYGKKIFVCNFSKLSYCDFPVKGICFLKKGNYQQFKQRISKILSCSNKYYQNNLNKKKNYIVNYNSKIDPNLIVKNFISKVIKKNV